MSSHHLSRREIEDLKPAIDKLVYKCLGYSDSSLVSSSMSYLTSGYDRRKVCDKFSSTIDQKKATKLSEKLFGLVEETYRSSRKRDYKESSDYKDREHKDEHNYKDREKDDHPHKKSRTDVDKDKKKGKDTNGNSVDSKSETALLSSDKIKMMMVSAQREIEERKRALSALKGGDSESSVAVSTAKAVAAQIKTQIHQAPASGVIKPQIYSQPTTIVSNKEDYEKQRRMAELQAKIQSKLSSLSSAVSVPPADKPRPLILDKEGNLVDQSGRQLQVAQLKPTLKANIRAMKREELKSQLVSKGNQQDQEEASWYDARVPVKPAIRTKRALRFHEPGKFQQMADRIRMKAQLEKLQSEISQIARKTGITSAAKLALLTPDSDEIEDVPEMEWWDCVILMTDEEREVLAVKNRLEGSKLLSLSKSVNLDDVNELIGNIKDDAITNLVEHPQQLQPPSEPTKPVYMPVFLTKRERKKLRRQTRREAWKEEQEKVRLGLEAPAEPKLRLSNLMRVLGSEAVQDPTKVEAHVREQMAKRQKAHLEANAARKLTHEQRTQRKIAKLKEDTSLGVHVGVYRVRDLFECCAKKFKVEKNAEQLFMTGCVVLHKGCCVVITEGGPKQHAKYKKLMMHRIKWEEDTVKDSDGNQVPNSCDLIWEGTTVSRAFGDVKFKVCPTPKLAREHLKKHEAQHYWDLAYSGMLINQQD